MINGLTPAFFLPEIRQWECFAQTTQPEEKDRTVEELLLEFCPSDDPYSKERYDFEKEYDRIFTGFGFDKEEKKKRLGDFSGGEQTKIAMIRLLLARRMFCCWMSQPTILTCRRYNGWKNTSGIMTGRR